MADTETGYADGGGEAFSFEVGEQPLDITFHPTRDIVAVGAPQTHPFHPSQEYCQQLPAASCLCC